MAQIIYFRVGNNNVVHTIPADALSPGMLANELYTRDGEWLLVLDDGLTDQQAPVMRILSSRKQWPSASDMAHEINLWLVRNRCF